MSDIISIREVQKALDSHETLDDTRFDTVCKTMDRVEAAIIDHAKSSAALSERTSVRTHERMDGIVASIAKVADSVDAVSDALHKRINGILWSALLAAVSAAAWMASQIFEALK